MAAFGRAADADVLRLGHRYALWCVGSCWALMLLPLLVPAAQLLVMALVAVWMWAERLEPPSPAVWRVRVPTTSGRIVTAQARVQARGSTRLRSRA